MLTATSTRTFGESRLRSIIGLERGVRAFLVWREQLLTDTRFFPPASRRHDAATVYLVLEGSMQIAGGELYRGPVAWVLDSSEFERVRPGATTFRSWGDPAITLELRLAPADVVGPVGLAAGPRPLSPATWDALGGLVDQAIEERPTEPAFLDLFERLGADQVIAPGIRAGATGVEPDHRARAWSGIRALYERLATSASLAELSELTGLSPRSMRREVVDLAKRFQLPGNSFRDIMRVMRLRAAVLFLSSPYATVSEVAEQIGYGTTDAMARAFRDAKLPPPSVVQAEVRYGAHPEAPAP